MVAVFAGFAAGDLVMFQQMGFGLGVAVLHRCDGRPLDPGAGEHEAARRLELVPAVVARAGCPNVHIEGAPEAAPPERAPRREPGIVAGGSE